MLLGFLFFSHDAVHINLTRNSSKHSVVGFSVFSHDAVVLGIQVNTVFGFSVVFS